MLLSNRLLLPLLLFVIGCALAPASSAETAADGSTFASLAAAQAAAIPATIASLAVQGVKAPGDTGLSMSLARLSSPPAEPTAPWIYQIGGSYWQLTNSTVTPQMFAYPGRLTAVEAIAEAGNYCNFRHGCRIELPAGTYMAMSGHSPAMIQNADWEIDFDQGARIVSGAGLQSSVLLIKDGADGKAQAHMLIIRNPVIDMTAGAQSADRMLDNAAIDVTGQKSLQIIDPVLTGGPTSHSQAGIGIATTGVADGEITGGTLRGFNNTAIYPEGYNIRQQMPQISAVTITGTCFYDNGQVVAAKRQLKLLVINRLCADRNDRGVGTYPAGGPQHGPGYSQAVEPSAQRVIINGGYIHDTPSRAIEFRDGTTGVLNNLDIQITGVTSDGRPVANCEAVQLIGASNVQFNGVKISLAPGPNQHCVAIASQNDQVLGHTFVSQGHNSNSGTGGISIVGFRYGYYEDREVGPSHLSGVRMSGVAVPMRATNPGSSVQH
jgi:hypothetical protein